jgi:hypothetical protein
MVRALAEVDSANVGLEVAYAENRKTQGISMLRRALQEVWSGKVTGGTHSLHDIDEGLMLRGTTG